MENELSLTQFLARLGCPLRIGYYWSAKSEDNSRVIFTIWSDQLNGDLYELWPSVDPLPDWTRLPGAHEWRRHIDVARGESVEILGVLCHAVDPAARRRERAYYDERSLLVMALEEKDGETFARVVGEVGVDIARDARVRGQVTPQRSALNDIFDAVPEGAEFPERRNAYGTEFRRDPMVGDYVLRRAKGQCEYCGKDGFLMPNGQKYLEAHHLVALGNNGPDTAGNVIALCPEHHRESHFGVEAEALNARMLGIVQQLCDSR